MKIAVFSDIHGNQEALERVLKDIELQKPDHVFCLGDLVGYGPRPNEVIEVIRDAKIPSVMGNYDDGVGFMKGDCGCAYVTDEEKVDGAKSIEWTTNQVTSKNKEYLRQLHDKIEFNVNGYKILFVHGSPRRINEYLYEDRPERSLTRMLEAVEADVVVCGHTHKPYHRVVGGVHLINDGSVGKPKDGDPRACYALINIDETVNVEFRRVEYPVEAVVQEIIAAGLPVAFADALRTAGKESCLNKPVQHPDTMYDLEKLLKNSEDSKQYIEASMKNAPQFMERYESYTLEQEMVPKIKCHSSNYTIFAFSAEWCPDCYRNIPVLAKLQEATGLKTRIFGHLMRDAKSSSKRWRIPPSPVEVEEFDVVKIPSMYVLDKAGNMVGEIIENPPAGKTLEAAILAILES